MSTVILYAKRTPIAKFNSSFAETSAPKLGAALVSDALNQTKISPDSIDEIIMGQVLTAGVGQAPARQTAIYGGLPTKVCATTINRVCGSGLKSVMLADQALRAGDAQLIFAGGQENMSRGPHLLPNSRSGYRYGNIEVLDHTQFDGLWDPYGNVAMGSCAEICAKEFQFSRSEQDAFARQSYLRARSAWENGHFAKEVVSVQTSLNRKNIAVDRDEEPFNADLDRLPTLKPAFDREHGTITAANASSINDGAALLLLASEEKAKTLGIQPLARIVAQASFAQEPKWFTTAPVSCIEAVLKKAKLTKDAIDIFEINEAFAVVAMAAIRQLGLDPARVNPYGGAVALGHPIGASGARVLVTLIHGLIAQNKKRGLAVLCIGGGEASAVVVERI